MRVVRAGTAASSQFRSKVLRLGLLAALLAAAAAGASFLRGQAQTAAGTQDASELVQPAAVPGDGRATQAVAQPVGAAEASIPNQEIGQLFAMANDLKTELAKTNQNTLSITVVRKAAAIEQLAHKVRTGGGGK